MSFVATVSSTPLPEPETTATPVEDCPEKGDGKLAAAATPIVIPTIMALAPIADIFLKLKFISRFYKPPFTSI